MRDDRKKVEPLVKTARGQIEAVLKMIEDDRQCMDILTQLSATEALLRKARKEVLKAHLNGCVRQAVSCDDPVERDAKLDEIITLLDKS